ncbi:MAG: hypothetical protein IKL96_01140 [Kiritimatiellae bacterium]|nr:hypothetical protein [Kiritimatiellia bacterium]
MKICICTYAAIAAIMVSAVVSAQGIADLDVNPDDIMLRKPNPAEQKAAAEKRAREEAAAKAAAEKAAAEKKAREDEMAKMAADRAAAEQMAREAAAAKTAAEQMAREAAAAKTAAEQKAREDAAALKQLREQLAAEQKAREQAQAEKADVEAKAAAAQKAADAALKKAADEKAALAAQAAAERKAADAAIEKANAAKDEAEKRAQRIASADPDERPRPTKKLEAPDEPAVASAQTDKQKKTAKKVLTGRPAVITAERTDYDRKEGIILFDRNVYVDDEQYQMHADRLWVFLNGTNDLKRLVALGNVAITNDLKTANCSRAVYNRAEQRIVMFGDGDDKPARLRDAGGKKGDASEVMGGRITYWLESGVATVEDVRVTLPAMKGGAAPKELFNIGGGKTKDKKKDE